MPWLQHEMSIQKFKMSQRVPTGSVASSRNGKNQGIPLKGPPLLFSYVPLPHFEHFIYTGDAKALLIFLSPEVKKVVPLERMLHAMPLQNLGIFKRKILQIQIPVFSSGKELNPALFYKHIIF